MIKELNILLADDDVDDRFFFDKVLKALPIASRLATVDNGEKLMDLLVKSNTALPDILFLDLNMPRKNGSECLSEIKSDPLLKQLPVVIYSTSMHEDVAELLYEAGAHYYVRKTNMKELKRVLTFILTLLMEKDFARPSQDKFILSLVEAGRF
ncbi:MAG: response regulator [Bacteroidia bacterium]